MADEPALAAAIFERAREGRRWTHNQVLTLTDGLRDEQVVWRPGPHAPSIGFHVWHLARWADHDAHRFDGSPELWVSESLAAAWGFPGVLGEADSGTGMGDDASEMLVLPGKAALLEYARAAFASLDETAERLAAGAMRVPGTGVADAVEVTITYATHDNRHLGMIEALRGLLGISGTATN
ncbi:MAG TPA: DinB family protein [Dehalococcoidia bacterium]|nr:DinB family protein [Dehalococcoidia bacterium]